MADLRARERQRAAAVGGPEDVQRALGPKLLPATLAPQLLAMVLLCVHYDARRRRLAPWPVNSGRRPSWAAEVYGRQIAASQGWPVGPPDLFWQDHERAAAARRERIAEDRADPWLGVVPLPRQTRGRPALWGAREDLRRIDAALRGPWEWVDPLREAQSQARLAALRDRAREIEGGARG